MSELKVHASVCESEPMVQSDEIKAAFVQRLKTALSQAGIPEWGAGARLAKKTEKTAKAASKWLTGESMPSRTNMLAIAEWLNVRAEWLAFGEGDMQPGNEAQTTRSTLVEDLQHQSSRHYQNDLYEAAPAEQREAVDDMADKMLKLTPEQARKLKQAMDLLMPDNGPSKN